MSIFEVARHSVRLSFFALRLYGRSPPFSCGTLIGPATLPLSHQQLTMKHTILLFFASLGVLGVPCHAADKDCSHAPRRCLRRWTSRRRCFRSTCRAASAPTWPRARTIRSTPARWCSTTAQPRSPWLSWTISGWRRKRAMKPRPSPRSSAASPVEKILVASTHTHSAPSLERQSRPGARGGLSEAPRRGDRGVHRPRPRRAAAGRRRRRRASVAGRSLQSPLVSQAGQDAAESLWQDGQGEDESRHESRRSRPSRRPHGPGYHHPLGAGREVAQAAGAVGQLLAALRRRHARGDGLGRLLRRVCAVDAVAGRRRTRTSSP